MFRRAIGFLVLLFLAAPLFAHEGHQHQQLLGTIERVRDCHLVVKTQEGETKAIFLVPTTKFERGGQAATKQDLKLGTRASITLENDGETATAIKIGGGR